MDKSKCVAVRWVELEPKPMQNVLLFFFIRSYGTQCEQLGMILTD